MSITILAIGTISPLLWQNATTGSCGPLHAGIRAELVKNDPSPFVMLSFILLNDGQTSVNAEEQGWTLLIDGKELGDSGRIFGNGPSPIHGWGVLNPGESFEFGKALPTSQYFPEGREYKVSWRGKGFQSSTISVRITDKQ